MSWIPTPESSTIAAFSYVAESKILMVEFKNGGRYNYYDVPEVLFERMRNAPSKGRFHAQSIKGVYRYARA